MYRIEIRQPDYDISAIQDGMAPDRDRFATTDDRWRKEIDAFADMLDGLSAKARTLSAVLAMEEGSELAEELQGMKSDLFAVHASLQHALGIAEGIEDRLAGAIRH